MKIYLWEWRRVEIHSVNPIIGVRDWFHLEDIDMILYLKSIGKEVDYSGYKEKSYCEFIYEIDL